MSKIKTLMVLAAMTACGSAQALVIDARLVSFAHTDANLNGTGAAGGIGTFQLMTDVTGTSVDFLGSTFMAQCLEPNENVSSGNTYRFEVVDLAAAPTSRGGGMGAIGAGWLESIMGGLGFGSVEDVAAASAGLQSAMQMATYEAAFETSGAFDFAAGAATLTGLGLTHAAAVHTALADPLSVDGFGLLNRAVLGGPQSRTVFRGQDFAVYNVETVAEPMPTALLGLGLLGLAGFTRMRAIK